MKKVIFATQVFGLIAIFPLYLVIELNHVTGQVTYNNAPSVINDKPAENSNQPGVKLKSDNTIFVIENALLPD